MKDEGEPKEEIVGEKFLANEHEEKRRLSDLEAEASALASDPNVWYATKFTRIIQLLEDISLQQKLMIDMAVERIDKEKKMQEQLGGMFGVLGGSVKPSTVLKGMFGRKKDNVEENVE